ncbi:MAG: TonB-dependent receptor [Acidobacteria bacterium]|nr:TonB-dependent receptor [Acidobacteriota bacterium]
MSPLVVLAVVGGAGLPAMQSSVIHGRVVDDSGAGIESARVSIQAGGSTLYGVTGAGGEFSVPRIPVGPYRLEATAPGFTKEVRDGVASGGSELQVPEIRLSRAASIQAIKGAEERNPNYFISKIDLHVVRETLRRSVIHPLAIEFDAAHPSYGAEFGVALRQLPLITPGERRPAFRHSIYASHQNSALNALPFFNIGPLRPSRRNQFGASSNGRLLGRNLFYMVELDCLKESGYVNGNVRIPRVDERVPRAADETTNRIILALLQGYPQEGPNLEDVAERQTNTNALRTIDNFDLTARLDYLGARHRAAARYAISDYSEDPFELVAGQNPKTSLRPQSISLTHEFNRGSHGIVRSSFHFDRLRALLTTTDWFRSLRAPLGLADVPDIDFGGDFGADLSPLGPKTEYPRNRNQNRFAFALGVIETRGPHRLQWGGTAARVQTNDLQSDNTRGRFVFDRNFGRSPIENFLLGTPTKFTITLGDLYHGFRHSEYALFLHDRWALRPDFTLSAGLRYEMTGAPSEVNGRIEFPFRSDANNFAPQFGFAWRSAPARLVVRGGYGISFGQVFPGTYQLARFNPPAVRTLTIPNPSLADPLRNVDLTAPSESRSERNLLSPDLVSPYTHQYNLTLAREFSRTALEVSYVGARTLKMFFPYVSNRAEPVPGIPATTATINLRRPDPRYLRIQTVINSGIAYFDALHASSRIRVLRGLAIDADYTFSKNLSSGHAFYSTLNREKGIALSQNNADFQADLKGPSEMDARHALVVNFLHELQPSCRLCGFLRGWRVSGSTAYRTGNWFNLTTSSDAPGFGNVDGEDDDRPNILNPSILGMSVDNPDTSATIFNPAFFDSDIEPGGRGNIASRVFRKDSLQNTNLSISRSFDLFREGRQLMFRMDLYNAFNHPQFERPGDVFPSPVFGRIIDTQNKGRVIQLMLRVDF